MIGTRIGTRIGVQIGVELGAQGLVSVPTDGPGNVYLPGAAADFTALGMVVPDSLWDFSGLAAGNAADAIGAVTLTAAGAPSYQQAVTGWAAKATQFTDGVAQRFGAAAGIGPNPSTTSSLWFWLIKTLAIPAANRVQCSVGDGATMQRAQVLTASGFLRDNCGGVTADGATNMAAVGVDLIAVQYDRANSVAATFSSHEKLVTTYNAGVIDALKGLGATAGTAPSMQTIRGWMYQGAKAEIASGAVKAMYTAMLWSVPWS